MDEQTRLWALEYSRINNQKTVLNMWSVDLVDLASRLSCSLTSVDFFRGRGEGIRMMLEYAGIHYTETAFTKDNWPTHKRTGTESGLYTFGQGKISVIRHMYAKN